MFSPHMLSKTLHLLLIDIVPLSVAVLLCVQRKVQNVLLYYTTIT